MNKAELIAAVAEKTGLSKKDSEKAVNAAFDTIVDTLVAGEKVQMVGFGVFARQGSLSSIRLRLSASSSILS